MTQESRHLTQEINHDYDLTDRGRDEPDLRAQEVNDTKTQEDPGSVM